MFAGLSSFRAAIFLRMDSLFRAASDDVDEWPDSELEVPRDSDIPPPRPNGMFSAQGRAKSLATRMTDESAESSRIPE